LSFFMAQQSDCPNESFHPEFSADLDPCVLRFPSRPTTGDLTNLPDQCAGPAATTRPQVSKRTIRQVTVLRVDGRLSDVIQDLDQAIELALTDEPRGVVCDLSAVREGQEPLAVEMLANTGRHVRDWPGIPVAVACPDPQVREALAAHRSGRHLIIAESLFCAVSAVLATPTPTVERLHLPPHPTAPRAARIFVTRTLLNWQLDWVAPFASQVASELVTRSSINAGTDIDLSLAWNHDALRLTVGDQGLDLPGQPHPGQPHPSHDLDGPSLIMVATLSRAFGVLPTANGGKVVWVVLDPPDRPQSTTRHRPRDESQEPLNVIHPESAAVQPSLRTLKRSHP
jgi:hypothetical protein